MQWAEAKEMIVGSRSRKTLPTLKTQLSGGVLQSCASPPHGSVPPTGIPHGVVLGVSDLFY